MWDNEKSFQAEAHALKEKKLRLPLSLCFITYNSRNDPQIYLIRAAMGYLLTK